MACFLLVKVILSLFTSNIQAQNWEETQELLIKNTSYFRTKIISKDTARLMQLEILLKKWEGLEPDEETLSNIFYYINDHAQNEYLFKWLKKTLERHYPESLIVKNLTETEYKLVSDYTELLELIRVEILDDEFPFNIKRDDDFILELEYYNLKNHQRIAEIGAGSGIFSFLLFFSNPSLKISINELWNKVSNIAFTLKRVSQYFNTDMIEVIKGNKKDTNLNGLYDRIIIRNTFHHFKKMKPMLKSIYKHLSDDGVLYIKERPIGFNNSPIYCEQQMDNEKIKTYINQSNFQIIEEYYLKDWIIYKCIKN